MFLYPANQHSKSYAVRIFLRENNHGVRFWGSQPLMCTLWHLTYPIEAPWGPQPQIWSYAGRWRPLCHQSTDGHTSEPHTSWAWPQPENGKKQRNVKKTHLLTDRMSWNTKKTKTNLATNSHRPVKDTMHAQNGRLWWVDDGCAEERAENSTITNRECATIHVLYCQLVLTRLWAKI